MKKKLFLLVGAVAVAAILLFAAVLPSFLLPPLTHKEEIELYSPNMLLVGFDVSMEWAKGHVPPRFSVPAFTLAPGIVSVMLIPGTFSFRGNVYPAFLAIAGVAVEPLGVGPSGGGWYVAKMFCNDTRVITILRGYNIPCDYVEVDYSFQTGETVNKSLVTLNDAEGNLLLSASIIWSEPTKVKWDYNENYYHLVGDNLTVAHRQVQVSLFSHPKANVTFPLNTFFFELTGVNYLFNTASVTMYGGRSEQGEIGWLT